MDRWMVSSSEHPLLSYLGVAKEVFWKHMATHSPLHCQKGLWKQQWA